MTFVERCAQRALTHLVTGLLCYLTGDSASWEKHKQAADKWTHAATQAARMQAEYNLPDSWFEQVEADAVDFVAGVTN